MNEFKTAVLGVIIIALYTVIYNAILANMTGLIIGLLPFSVFIPLIITFLVGIKLNDEFKTSLLYGILLGLVYVTIDAMIKGFFDLRAYNIPVTYIILFMAVFAASCAIGSRVGMVKNAWDEIKNEKSDKKND